MLILEPTLLTQLLANESGKAEIINGELVYRSPTGFLTSHAAGIIYASLLAYAQQTRSGYAIPDNAGFLVNLPNRQSFSPDASFYIGKPTGMRFLEGAPIFAVEVRGNTAELAIAAKRADYFAAGTVVVWDVDLLSNDIIRAYCVAAPDEAVVFRRGDNAHAEPAITGWFLPVESLFPYYL